MGMDGGWGETRGGGRLRYETAKQYCTGSCEQINTKNLGGGCSSGGQQPALKQFREKTGPVCRWGQGRKRSRRRQQGKKSLTSESRERMGQRCCIILP